MESLDLSVDEPPISVQRMKVRKRFRRGLLAMYFIGIMFSLRNKVQICGALRPVEYFEAFEPIKIVQEEKPGFLVLLYLPFFQGKLISLLAYPSYE